MRCIGNGESSDVVWTIECAGAGFWRTASCEADWLARGVMRREVSVARSRGDGGHEDEFAMWIWAGSRFCVEICWLGSCESEVVATGRRWRCHNWRRTRGGIY